jgi:hypothetical protein
MRNALTRDRALQAYVWPFGQIGQVGHRLVVADGFGEGVTAVKTEPTREPLLNL